MMDGEFVMPLPHHEIEDLPSLSYRQLQAQAKQWELPGNFKRNALLEMIRARSVGDEERVKRIIGEQQECRARRRAMTGQTRKVGRPRRDSFNDGWDDGKNNHEGPLNCSSSSFYDTGCSNAAAMSIEQLLRAANVPNAATKQLFPKDDLQHKRHFSPEELPNVSLTQHFSGAFSALTFNNMNGCGVISQNTPVDLSIPTNTFCPVNWNEKLVLNNNNNCHPGEQWQSQEPQWTMPPLDYSCPLPHAHGLYEEIVIAQSPSSDTLSAFEDSSQGNTECAQDAESVPVQVTEFSQQECQPNEEIAALNSVVNEQESSLRYAANTLGVSQLTDSAGLIMTGLNMVDQQEWAYYYAASSISNCEVLPNISSILPHSPICSVQAQQILPFNYSQP